MFNTSLSTKRNIYDTAKCNPNLLLMKSTIRVLILAICIGTVRCQTCDIGTPSDVLNKCAYYENDRCGIFAPHVVNDELTFQAPYTVDGDQYTEFLTYHQVDGVAGYIEFDLEYPRSVTSVRTIIFINGNDDHIENAAIRVGNTEWCANPICGQTVRASAYDGVVVTCHAAGRYVCVHTDGVQADIMWIDEVQAMVCPDFPCPDAKVAPLGRTSLQDCVFSAGSHSNSTTCIKCETGSYKEQDCSTCGPGQYTPLAGATTCTNCAVDYILESWAPIRVSSAQGTRAPQ